MEDFNVPANIFRRFAFSTLIFLAAAGINRAATLPAGFSETPFASGMTSPTAFAFAPDGRLFLPARRPTPGDQKRNAAPDAFCRAERRFRR
jgi:hypothetical protein